MTNIYIYILFFKPIYCSPLSEASPKILIDKHGKATKTQRCPVTVIVSFFLVHEAKPLLLCPLTSPRLQKLLIVPTMEEATRLGGLHNRNWTIIPTLNSLWVHIHPTLDLLQWRFQNGSGREDCNVDNFSILKRDHVAVITREKPKIKSSQRPFSSEWCPHCETFQYSIAIIPPINVDF